ncbi:MAG: (Fe-S)-binding protein [Pelotomaculum sp.]|jgi:molybdopterin-guanine dinucleotide biosynthesis protein B
MVYQKISCGEEMKILAVCGTDLEFVSKMVQALVEELTYCRYQVAWWRQEVGKDLPNQGVLEHTLLEVHNGYSQIYLPGQLTLEDSMPYLAHDFVIVEGEQGSAPQLICAANESDLKNLWTPLALAGVVTRHEFEENHHGQPVFAISQIKDLVKFLINAVPERLPFLVPNPCCGACGRSDCKSMMADIVAGKAELKDCAILNAKVEIKIGDQELVLVEFVQDFIKKTVTGMLSALDGYRENSSIEIKIK